MSADHKISLEFKCPISLDSLKKNGTHFYCQNCSKNLVDFRGHNIGKFHKVTDEKICGIFNKSRLSKDFLRTSLTTIVVTSIISYHTYSQEVDIEIEEEEEIEVVEEDIFIGSIIEQNAEPIGGYLKFFDASTKEIKFPKRLKKYGKVWVQFSIDTTSKMSDFKVVKGLEKKADKEAIRALKAIDYPFTPCEQRGKKVKSRMIIPIDFKKDISQSPLNTPSNE